MDNGPVQGHSLFTGCLLEALDGGMATDGELVTGTQLGLHLQQRVTQYPSSMQTPDFGSLEADRRGELIIRISTTAARAEAAHWEAVRTEAARLETVKIASPHPNTAGVVRNVLAIETNRRRPHLRVVWAAIVTLVVLGTGVIGYLMGGEEPIRSRPVKPVSETRSSLPLGPTGPGGTASAVVSAPPSEMPLMPTAPGSL